MVIEGTIVEKGNTYDTEKGRMTRYVVALERFAYADDGIKRQGQVSRIASKYSYWQPLLAGGMHCSSCEKD